MKLTDSQFKKILLEANLISAEQFELAQKEESEENEELSQALVDRGLIKNEELGQLIAQEIGFDFIDLRKEKIDDKILHLIPELVARSRGVAAVSRTEEGVKLGMTDPGDLETRHLVEKRLGQKVLTYYITPKDLEEALTRYKSSLKEEFENILKQLRDKTLVREKQDEATVKMVDTLLLYGYQNKASDIHIEPYAKKVLIRFRIDGIMHDVLEIPRSLLDLILTRIKILSKMRTDEHRAAQDGKLRFASQAGLGGSTTRIDAGQEAGGEMVDVRVSVVPVTNGENVVMRLLSAKSRQFALADLGLGEPDFKKIKQAIKYTHGMILVTGPTGCGKTTTLYALMKILNKRETHIATIEDPVEYDIEGISQIQVNPKTNLTFAKGLRAIVRQDPDIIMVGEIRDEETAGIAVNSALTGHLVLSTLHTNDAATTLPRLLDMGIEPFLVASTVRVAIAQRLVRKICEKCRMSYVPSESELNLLPINLKTDLLERVGERGAEKHLRLYKGGGCKICGNTGYSGRIGIFEVLEMAENIKELVLKNASSDEIVKVARENGMATMLEDGIGKVFAGITSTEELVRVIHE